MSVKLMSSSPPLSEQGCQLHKSSFFKTRQQKGGHSCTAGLGDPLNADSSCHQGQALLTGWLDLWVQAS